MSFTNPGMVGSMFSPGGTFPPAIGNRVFWWDTTGQAGGSFLNTGATTPATDNTRVLSIKGAAGQAFSQTDSDHAPLFRNNRQNSLPGLLFNSSRGDYLENPTGGLLNAVHATTAMTILIVWRPLGGSDQCVLHLCRDEQGIRIGPTTSSRIRGYRHGNRSEDEECEMTSAATFARTSALLFTYPGLSGTMRLDDNHGNSDTAATDAAEDTSLWTDGQIGAAIGPQDRYNGELFEMLILDAAADSSERTALLSYATTKWGLT